MTSAAELLRQRARAAARYKPEPIDLLIVAEAPPSEPSRYFYFEDVRTQDALFRYVASTILGERPTRENKPDLLLKLRDRGVFLIDLKLDPADGSPLARHVPALVERCRALRPRAVILIKTTVYDAAYRPPRTSRTPVVDERIPFPGSGQQKRFEEAFTRALNKARPIG